MKPWRLIELDVNMRIWVGDFKEKNIIEIFECPHKNGIYLM